MTKLGKMGGRGKKKLGKNGREGTEENVARLREGRRETRGGEEGQGRNGERPTPCPVMILKCKK